MNKNELISAVAKKSGLTKADSARAIDSFIASVSDSLGKNQEVRLVGFGTFAVAQRKATEGRNPRTGEKIKIPAKKSPKFRAGKALKEKVSKR